MKEKSKVKIGKKSFSNPLAILVVVVVGAFGVFLASQIFAASASLSIVPSGSTASIGNTFTVAIRVNSGTETINQVTSNLQYDSTKLQYVSYSDAGSGFGGSYITDVTTPGVVNITRGTSGGAAPVTGDKLVTTVTFKAIASGAAAFSFTANSNVASSVDNTDILSVRGTATVTVSDSTAPSVPASLSSSNVSYTSATVNWAASTDNVGVTGYTIYRNGTQVGTSTTTSFSSTGLTPATTYQFKVAARDAIGNTSAQSTALSVTTLIDSVAPSVPGKPTSSAQTMTSITLNWTASTDNVALVGYRVFRNGALVASPTSTTYTDTGLTPQTSYSYTIAAYDSSGVMSAQSAATPVSTLADNVAPSIPTGLKSSVSAGNNVTLNWTASTDNVAVTGYKIYRNGTQITTSSTNSIILTNTPSGTSNYSVAAYDAKGNTSAQTATVATTVYNTADIDKDSKVNGIDLSTLLSNWLQTGANTSDINGDGIVNGLDLSKLLSSWTG